MLARDGFTNVGLSLTDEAGVRAGGACIATFAADGKRAACNAARLFLAGHAATSRLLHARRDAGRPLHV